MPHLAGGWDTWWSLGLPQTAQRSRSDGEGGLGLHQGEEVEQQAHDHPGRRAWQGRPSVKLLRIGLSLAILYSLFTYRQSTEYSEGPSVGHTFGELQRIDALSDAPLVY